MPLNHTLKVWLLEAKLSKDYDYLSKNDPYIVLDFNNGAMKWMSAIQSDVGRNPVWWKIENQFMEVRVTDPNQQIKLACYDDNGAKKTPDFCG